jgi:NADPH-dependent 2,4-dienoyl-CoA reductase/sulfur reductase-like enzyme
MPLRDAAFYEGERIDARFGREVTEIDRAARAVTLDGGERIRWDALLLAPGAVPIRLPIPGMDRPNVHVLRTFEQGRALQRAAAGAKRAVVLGASFVGLECAMSLSKLGLEVAVAAPDEVPLGKILGPEVGAFLRQRYEARGIRFHLGAAATAIGEDVTLSDGRRLPADLVVAGVGVRPDVALAQAAGLAVDDGVVVDAELCAAPGVWVAGDAARFPDRDGELVRIEHWVVAMAQGRCAARNVLGAREPYRGVPFFWSAHDDVTLAMVGRAARWDRIDRLGALEDGAAALAYRDGGRTRAVLTLNRDDVSLAAEEAFSRGDEAALQALIPPG